MTTETKTETVREFCSRNRLKMRAKRVDRRHDHANDEWSKEALHFDVSLYTGGDGDGPEREVWAGYYSVGSGRPEMWARKPGIPFAVSSNWGKLKNEHPRSIYAEQLRSQLREQFQRAAENRDGTRDKDPLQVWDVVESLRLDAMSSDQDFPDWAIELGYSDDSIRAKSMWEACGNTRRALQANLPRGEYNRLMDCKED